MSSITENVWVVVSKIDGDVIVEVYRNRTNAAYRAHVLMASRATDASYGEGGNAVRLDASDGEGWAFVREAAVGDA